MVPWQFVVAGKKAPSGSFQFYVFLRQKSVFVPSFLVFTFKSLRRSPLTNTGMAAAYLSLGFIRDSAANVTVLFNQDNFDHEHETKKATWETPGH
jgi:hypothetical protein